MKLARTHKRLLQLSSSALVIALFLLTSGAQAATLNVVAGQLTGASGVDVGGFLYNVEFVEGTCISLFGGCDEASDFAFNDLASANLASQALLDQVYLDGLAGNFDTVPTSILGCSWPDLCSAQTPYALVDPDSVSVGVALNGVLEENDGIGGGDNLRTADSSVGTVGQFYSFAVWSPVPEPGTGLLVGLGLLVMGARTRRDA